jgi:hypothetical protein
LSILAPRYLRVLEKHTTTYSTWERRLLEGEPQKDTLAINAMRNLNTATPGEAKQIGSDTASSTDEISKSLTQQGDKGAKSPLDIFEGIALPT